jgi:hypothetical protein
MPVPYVRTPCIQIAAQSVWAVEPAASGGATPSNQIASTRFRIGTLRGGETISGTTLNTEWKFINTIPILQSVSMHVSIKFEMEDLYWTVSVGFIFVPVV